MALTSISRRELLKASGLLVGFNLFEPILGGREWNRTRAHRVPIHDDRASAALPEPAAELRPLQAEVIAQHV